MVVFVVENLKKCEVKRLIKCTRIRLTDMPILPAGWDLYDSTSMNIFVVKVDVGPVKDGRKNIKVFFSKLFTAGTSWSPKKRRTAEDRSFSPMLRAFTLICIPPLVGPEDGEIANISGRV